MRIIQVVQCFDYGDGIGNDIQKKHQIFKRLGYESRIYAVHVDIRLKDIAEHISQLHAEPGDILMLHYSGFCTMLKEVDSVKCTKVLVYHNITPPEFFDDGPVKEHCRMGLVQLTELSGKFDFYVGDSEYNVNCLKSMGVTSKGKALPIVVEFPEAAGIRAQKKPGAETLFLFVGRIVQNKKIEDIIAVFDWYYCNIDKNSRLLIPGNTGAAESYTAMLRSLIASLPSKNNIELMGKVPDEKLRNIFLSADMYLSMSEHEGFGIPLLEAMNYGIPVLAYDTAAVGETMGSSGILVKTKEPSAVAKIAYEVLKDKQALEEIIAAQRENIERFSMERIQKLTAQMIDVWTGKRQETEQKPTVNKIRYSSVQMQGPFETSYSLAIVNRKLIEAIDHAGFADASIHCMEGGGDYEPELKNLADKPQAKALWEKGKGVDFPDVGIRQMYPPTGQPTTAKYSFQAFGWEEDRIPQKYIKDFNETLCGIGTMSEFVTRSLLDSGLKIPVKTMGLGVELPQNFEQIQSFPLNTKKGTVFLHISSCFPRKGVDVLLKAYFETFTAEDDVCLVIKTFPNPHNRTEEQLSVLRKKYGEGSPEVILLNYDMPEEELFSLYKAASCYVHSARGEGFGLPVAEAMLCRLPVIACNNTGLADFTTEDTALVFGYTMQPAHSHLTENSNWAEPDIDGLKKRLRDFAFARETLDIEKKVENAFKLISTKYTWDAVALRWKAFLDETIENVPRVKAAMVTTWNTKCGIAEFTRMQMRATDHLAEYSVFPDRTQSILHDDESYVFPRTWTQFDKGVDGLISELKASDSEVVELQYNFAFYSVISLGRIIEALYKTKPVVVHLHSAKYFDDHINKSNEKFIKKAYNKAAAFIVHQAEDINYLIKHGVKRSLIRVIPLGQLTCPQEDKNRVRDCLGIQDKEPVLASYGFLLPNKGVQKTIEAIALLKNQYPNILFIASCAMFGLDVSKEYYENCRNTVNELGLQDNVVMIPDYLEPEESFKLLHAADACVMVYDKTHESSSGAVRFCAAALRPILTTRQNIFKEFEEGTLQIEDNSPSEIAKGLTQLLKDSGLQRRLVERLKAKIDEISWRNVGAQYAAVYEEALNGKKKK